MGAVVALPKTRKLEMKIVVLIDWSDDQSKMPQQPGCLEEAPYRKNATRRSRRVMKSFEFWRRKYCTAETGRDYRLVLWHTHYPWRFMPPTEIPEGEPYPWDCRANLLEKQVEAIAKNYDADEPVFLADDSFVFYDNFDLEPLIEQAMQPNTGIVLANNAWVLNPTMQRLIGGIDADPTGERFEKEWAEADFCEWVDRTTWTFAKTYADTSPHEYAALSKSNSTLLDLYKATMFIMRNGFVQMYYHVPFCAYVVNNRRYWTYMSYDLVNRSLEGDLKVYQ
jgi:hypothetical protein